MARGKSIDPELAGAVQGMADQNQTRQQIAGATGVPLRTITNILNGTHGWPEIKNSDSQFLKYRNQTKRELQVARWK